MKLLILTILGSALAAIAGSTHLGADAVARHAKLAQRANSSADVATPRTLNKRASCSAKHKAKKEKEKTNQLNKGSTTTTTAKAKSTTKKSSSESSGGTSNSVGGVINVKSTCGPIKATKKTTNHGGPNGDIVWLNCGIDGGGWRPPNIGVDDIIYTPLSVALKDPKSPYHACKAYTSLFTKYAHMYGVPDILIAAFALQESSCKPGTIGGGGEQGLMQITRDKCKGRSDSACREPDYNIHTGTKFFADTLDQSGGNLPLAIGRYNGWKPGLTVKEATAARHSKCCRCQNNLDYIQQMLNGWILNIDAYSHNLGTYFNLNVCGPH